MFNRYLFFLFSLFSTCCISQDFVQENTNISCFSNAAIEDIFSESEQCNSTLNGEKKLFSYEIDIASFEFKDPLKKDHFNENYLESIKIPKAEYNGNILGDSNLLKHGTHKVFLERNPSIHVALKQVKIIVENGNINIVSKVAINLEDHKVKVPTFMKRRLLKL
jgi:hypothetical protein